MPPGGEIGFYLKVSANAKICFAFSGPVRRLWRRTGPEKASEVGPLSSWGSRPRLRCVAAPQLISTCVYCIFISRETCISLCSTNWRVAHLNLVVRKGSANARKVDARNVVNNYWLLSRLKKNICADHRVTLVVDGEIHDGRLG